MSDTIPAGGIFYLQVSVMTSDGALDPSLESPGGYLKIDDAIATVVEDIEAHGGTSYIYECKAVRKILRGKTRIITVKK